MAGNDAEDGGGDRRVNSNAIGALLGKQRMRPLDDVGILSDVAELANRDRIKLIGVIAVVFNDNPFGNVKRTQADQFGGRLIGSELANPDFVALANSFGIAATRVETPTELTAVISSVSLQPDSGKPFLVEVPVGPMPTP